MLRVVVGFGVRVVPPTDVEAPPTPTPMDKRGLALPNSAASISSIDDAWMLLVFLVEVVGLVIVLLPLPRLRSFGVGVAAGK